MKEMQAFYQQLIAAETEGAPEVCSLAALAQLSLTELREANGTSGWSSWHSPE